MHLVFEDETKKILGEVNDVNDDTVNASFLGEIVGNRFLGGTIRKPRLDAKIRVINNDEIQLLQDGMKEDLGNWEISPFMNDPQYFWIVNNFLVVILQFLVIVVLVINVVISRLFQNSFKR